MNKLKNKLSNTNFNFAKNIYTSIVVPAVILVVALVFAFVFGFNKGMDFNGGIIVSVVTDEYNLEVSEEYGVFKGKVDKILQDNGVSGSVYLTEKHTTYQDDILVVKINYTGENTESIVSGIKEDLIAKFYSGEELLVEQNHLVDVSTFGSSVDSWKIIASILATLIAVIAICVYVGFRTLSMHAPVMAFVSAVCASILAMSLVMLARIQISIYSLAVIPMVAIISMIGTFIYANKIKEHLKIGDYERKSNSILVNDTVKSGLHITTYLSVLASIVALVFTFANVISIVSHLGLTILVAVVSIAYNYVFVMPAIYALTYVRKVKKEKLKLIIILIIKEKMKE